MECNFHPFDGKRQSLEMSPTHFFVNSYRFRYNNFKFLPSKSMLRSLSAIFSITPFDGKCQNLQISPTHFPATIQYLQHNTPTTKQLSYGGICRGRFKVIFV